MRHGKKGNHLGRTDSHRKAMLANMASSLIKHKRISTTLAKAKALRMYVEPLLTKSKTDTTHSRRIVFSYLQDKDTVTELFRDVAAKIASRPGGYTRIIKLNNRLGDNAEMALIELVDYNEVYGKEAGAAEKKTTRRGRSKVKKTDAPAAEAAKEEAAVEETPATETPAEGEEKKEA
ncbi:50S ribosomal protein L17 [Pedobacter immunditicola]|uniref:50S ribosomal protein L17 n=1 Tax=Pedobacter immunditicola TaxID=3133440 RepID=UPI0030B46AA7